jgi:hypothetical protein
LNPEPAGWGGWWWGAHPFEHTPDAVFGVCRNKRPGVAAEVGVPRAKDAVEDLLLSITPEGRYATEQDVQYDACTPDVSFLAVLSLQHLHQPTGYGLMYGLYGLYGYILLVMDTLVSKEQSPGTGREHEVLKQKHN